MRKFRFVLLLLLSPLSLFAQQVLNLTCNYDKDPIALDDLHPRLSWQINSEQRGFIQRGYQILVSSSVNNTGDVWDSGKNVTDKSRYILYNGKTLLTGRVYYWRVRVWGQNAKPSVWSDMAKWQMGLLYPSDWAAKWITASKWFTPPEFRPKGFELGPDGGWADVDLGRSMPIESIKLFPLNKASFPLRFQLMGANNLCFVNSNLLIDQSKQDHQITESGEQKFNVKGTYRFIRLKVLGNSAKRNTIVRQMQVFSNGHDVALMRFTREQGTAWDHGHAPFLVDGMPSQNDGETCPANACPSVAAPVLRKRFEVNKKIKKATLYYAALGMADISVNGQKVGNDVLGPPFTDYNKRVMYCTYDITALLNKGQNVIGAVLGNGFFSTPLLGFGQRQNGNGPPKLLLQAKIIYTDGSQKTIVTDDTWKWSRSEITFNDVWAGYTEDRHLQKQGWDRPDYEDKDWYNVKVSDGPNGKLVARSGPPNRINALIKPVSVSNNHAYFASASVGWPLLKVNGKAGQKITITGSGSGYKMARLTFILAVDGSTTLLPRFIIQPGPTDIKVVGLSTPLTLDDISIQYVNADIKETGEFSCSNTFLNDLYKTTLYTHHNYINDFPADPNREKQGWTQDVQNMFNTAAYFTDVRDLYWRWWNDMADNQDEEGYLGSVIPMVNRQVYDWNSPWWSGMIVFLPWQHYQQYGNSQVLEKSYNAMRAYVDFLGKMAATGEGKNWYSYPYFTQDLDTAAAKEKMIIWNGAGDWNNPYTNTQHAVPTPMTTMPAWYCYAQILSKTADILHNTHDAIKYAAIAKDVKDKFNKRYFNPQTGLYGDNTNSQTGQVLPLALGMVPDNKDELTYQRLIDAIHLRGDHVGTGFVSINYLLQTLATRRESALANKMINQKDYPGWNTLIKGGVLQEDWHGGGAQMPSCGGAVGAWLFQSVLGIQPDPDYPGFKEFIISPQPDKLTGLTWAKGYYDSGYGKITVEWKCTGDKFMIDVSVPANTKARLVIPADDTLSVKESGRSFKGDKNIIYINYNKGVATYLLNSGTYYFETKYIW